MNFSSVAAVSIAILGLLAIPFMANSVTSNAIANYDEGISVVLNSTPSNFSATSARKYPGEVEESLSPRHYRFSTETAFGRLEMASNSTGMRMSLSRAGEVVSMETRSGGKVEEVWKLETPEFTLESAKSFDRVEERYSIPSGYCIRSVDNGAVAERCYGQIGKIDDEWQEARERLREMAGKLKEVAESLELPNPDSVQWKYS